MSRNNKTNKMACAPSEDWHEESLGPQLPIECTVKTDQTGLYTFEPRDDKTNKMSVRPAKTQISLGIRPV